jgi:hypothetical protein
MGAYREIELGRATFKTIDLARQRCKRAEPLFWGELDRRFIAELGKEGGQRTGQCPLSARRILLASLSVPARSRS